jgi:hypothetical protein
MKSLMEIKMSHRKLKMTVSLVVKLLNVIIIYIILCKGVLSIHLDNTPLHILLNKLSICCRV